MKTIGCAVLGLGRIGSLHAENLAVMPTARLTYLAEANPSLLARMCKKYDVTPANDLEEILADKKTDLLILCTPTPTHSGMIKRAVRAGKAVFCEKPLCGSLQEALDCTSYVRRYDGKMMVGFNRRFDRDNILLKESIRTVGSLEHIRIISRDPAPPPLAYIRQWGGLFMDMTIHDFDMALHLMPDPPESLAVMASVLTGALIGEAGETGDADSALISMKTASGCLVSIHNSLCACYGYDQRIEIFGSKGMLQTANQKRDHLILANKNGIHRAPLKYFFMERYAESYKQELADFVRALAGDQKLLKELRSIDGVNAIYLAQMAKESLKTGRSLKLRLPREF